MTAAVLVENRHRRGAAVWRCSSRARWRSPCVIRGGAKPASNCSSCTSARFFRRAGKFFTKRGRPEPSCTNSPSVSTQSFIRAGRDGLAGLSGRPARGRRGGLPLRRNRRRAAWPDQAWTGRGKNAGRGQHGARREPRIRLACGRRQCSRADGQRPPARSRSACAPERLSRAQPGDSALCHHSRKTRHRLPFANSAQSTPSIRTLNWSGSRTNPTRRHSRRFHNAEYSSESEPDVALLADGRIPDGLDFGGLVAAGRAASRNSGASSR